MFFGSIHIRKTIVTLSLSVLGLYGCTTDEQFPAIDTNFAGPVDVVSVGDYAFVLNSDFDRKYNTGSILTVDPSQVTGSEKLASHLVPRMGRSLYASGQFLIGTYDRVELSGMGSVEIYSVANDGSLSTSYSQELDCSPISAVISESQSWAVVSCLGGEVYIAPLDSGNIASTSFHYVRNYGYARRALYIYEQGSTAQLLAFPTDLGEQTSGDFGGNDVIKYEPNQESTGTDSTVYVDGSNEVPDDFESSASKIRSYASRYPYQMAVLNLNVSQDNGFPLKIMASAIEANDTVTLASNGKTVFEHANNELKFIYFNLDNNGDAPNTNSGTVVADVDSNVLFYRTNFWTAQPGGTAGEFYLSHRGLAGANDSNNILKVIVNGSDVFAGPAADTPSEFSNEFKSMLTISREFGFHAVAKSGYPGDFAVTDLNGENYVFVNQFRDEAYWDASSKMYAIDAKNTSRNDHESLPPNRWVGADFRLSAYELALIGNSGGADPSYLISCSFYGDSMLVFPIDKDNGIDIETGPTVIY